MAPPTINLDHPAVDSSYDLAANQAKHRRIDLALSKLLWLWRLECLPGLCTDGNCMIRRLLLIVLALALVAAGSAYGLWKYGERQFYRPGPSTEASYFFIERGASFNRVASDLADSGLISSQLIFSLGARISDQNGLLKFGNYEIPAHASMEGILALITDASAVTDQFLVTYRLSAETGTTLVHERKPGGGEVREVVRFTAGEVPPAQYTSLSGSGVPSGWRVAVPEGLTSWQIVEALKAAEFLQGELVEVPPEGSLAPDTYEVKRGSGRDQLVRRMLERQQSHLDAEWQNRAANLPIFTPEQALVLASIIEKETSIDSERELVSSVFVNRLNRSMLLQNGSECHLRNYRWQAAIGTRAAQERT